MNKIFNINLGGYPFTIDDDAYHKLDHYLSTVQKHFSNSEGCEDIISDIEIRIAELFNEHLKGQPIVGLREGEKIISIMGTPEEFGATIEDEPQNTKADSTKSNKTHAGKRLFRDPDEKVIAGVCSGLAAYLGIQEPVWVRLFMVLLIFTGFAPLIYIVLWIAIPEAKTSGDKLSMRGEKIDVSNIARKVEEEINNLADTITEMTKDIGSKKSVSPEPDENTKSIISQVLTNFGRFIASIVKFVVYIVSRFVKVIALILIGAIAISIGALILSGHFGLPYLTLIAPNPPISGYIGYYCAIIAFGIIPLILLIKTAINFIGGYKTSLRFKKSLSGVWIVSFMIFILTSVFTMRNFIHDASKTELLSESTINLDEPLNIHVQNEDYHSSPRIQFSDRAFLTNGKLFNGEDIYVYFEPSDSESNVQITKTSYSRGMNERSALYNTRYPKHDISINENDLKIDELYKIGKRDKFRDQKLQYNIALPVGTKIKLKDRSNIFRNPEFRKRNAREHTWVMTDNGLELSQES